MSGRPPRRIKRNNFLHGSRRRSPSGPIFIIVNIDDEIAFVYRNGIQIGQTPVSTGRPGYPTPTGVFSILGKDAKHRSKKYNNAAMPYAERLTWSGIFLHGGDLPGYPSSHGCVHLPLAFAKDLFEITQANDTTVVITKSTSQPSETAPIEQLLRTVEANTSGGQPSNDVVWEPNKSKDGSVAIVVSGLDKRIEVASGWDPNRPSRDQLRRPQHVSGRGCLLKAATWSGQLFPGLERSADRGPANKLRIRSAWGDSRSPSAWHRAEQATRPWHPADHNARLAQAR